MSLIIKAKVLAKKAHAEQVRKYTKQAYFWHPFRVATETMALDYATEDMIAAAFLHDTIEDCGMTYDFIDFFLNKQIADIVLGLTSYSKQVKSTANRRDRKKMDLEYLSKQSNEVKVIKMLDRIDNLEDLCDYGEPDFVTMYCKESRDLLSVLESADEVIAKKLKGTIEHADKYYSKPV